MTWTPPTDWVWVSQEEFMHILDDGRDYTLHGWSGALVCRDVPTGTEFAASLDDGRFVVHPDLVR